jgi:hypothetical protein
VIREWVENINYLASLRFYKYPEMPNDASISAFADDVKRYIDALLADLGVTVQPEILPPAGEETRVSFPPIGVGAPVQVVLINTEGTAKLYAATAPLPSQIAIVETGEVYNLMHAGPAMPMYRQEVTDSLPPAGEAKSEECGSSPWNGAVPVEIVVEYKNGVRSRWIIYPSKMMPPAVRCMGIFYRITRSIQNGHMLYNHMPQGYTGNDYKDCHRI